MVDESAMHEPMSHYFINSSHNTYRGGTSCCPTRPPDAGQARALHGCVVIELDCYDGGKDGPIIKHGGTRTKPITFRSAIAAIEADAHTVSEYPCIVTLENHLQRRDEPSPRWRTSRRRSSATSSPSRRAGTWRPGRPRRLCAAA